MLHQIVQYARNENLDTEPGFSPKFVKWAIECDSDGNFLGLLPLAKDKKDRGREFPKCPNLTQPEMKAGGVTKSHFLVESLSVIANLQEKNDEKERQKTQQKHEYFSKMLQSAAPLDSTLSGPALFFTNSQAIDELRQAIANKKANLIDQATFFVDNIFPVNRTEWHPWWRQHRQTLSGKSVKTQQENGTVRCFLSGELVTPAATHEKIKGLTDVGGLAMGDVLIGFKQESFCSFGFEQSANAAMSTEAAKAYVAGLNNIILRQSRRLAVTKIAFWFKKSVTPEDDAYNFICQGDENEKGSALKRMRELLSAIQEGSRPDLADNEYYGLDLSSNGGRVVVRSWWEGSFTDLLSQTIRWFDDLSIIHPKSRQLAPAPKFFAVLNAAVRVPDDIEAPLEMSLWRAALRGTEIPEIIHTKTLMRVRAQVVSGEPITFVQAGLLKAFHRRRNLMIDVQLDPQGPTPYQCGRLLASLADLQRAALGDVGAGVVERFYPAASATPALVLGRLVLNAQNHLQKIRGDRPGLAYWFDQQIQDILAVIPISSLPKTLSLEEQSLFALGFYHQKAMQKKEPENTSEPK